MHILILVFILFVILWKNVYWQILLLYIFKFATCRFISWQRQIGQICLIFSTVDMTNKTNTWYFLANILYILHSHLFICKYMNLKKKFLIAIL